MGLEIATSSILLVSEKMNNLKSQKLFLDLREKGFLGQTAAPKVGEASKSNHTYKNKILHGN